ncbi:glycosyltransferase family 39 protein [Peterkaempfera sp. SMS 1(5)a]|uniref:glycosyltransferase family 39 protein n=1 Tax=Peterkaempfera podocarpi TaxID=3232308 RepID=UPI00366C220D
MDTPVTLARPVDADDTASSPAVPQRLGREAWAVVAASVAAMLAVGFWGLDRGSMWQDEEATFDASRRTVPQILAMVHHVDAVHAVYYLLMHFWMLPGGGEVWMRVPSVLAAGAAAGLVAALGARLLSPRAGLFAGLVFAVIPFVSFYAQEGRSYALVCAVVLLATWCLVRAVEDPGARWWWAGYTAASTFAALLHEFAVLALLAHAVTLLLSRVPGRVLRRWLVCTVVCGVLLAPLALVSRSQSTQVSWLERPGWGTVWALLKLLAGPVTGVLVLLAALVAAGLTTSWRAGGRLTLAAVAAPLAVLPPAVLLLVSLQQPMYHERYVLFAVAGVPLLAAAGLERIVSVFLARARLRRPEALPRALAALPWVLGAAVVAAVLVPQLPQQRAERDVLSRSDNLAGAARVVRKGARPGDAVVFMPSKYRAARLGYPEAFKGLEDIAMQRTPVQAANLRGTDRSKRAIREAMLKADRIWVVGRGGLKVRAGEGGALDEQAVLQQYFRPVSSVRVHGLEVRLYVRTS